jgi:hypothetical protein
MGAVLFILRKSLAGRTSPTRHRHTEATALQKRFPISLFPAASRFVRRSDWTTRHPESVLIRGTVTNCGPPK